MRKPLLSALLACVSMMLLMGCAAAPGERPVRDQIADAERRVQRLTDSINAALPLIKDQTARDVLDGVLGEVNDALAEAHRLESAGEPIDGAYVRDRVWAVINRAIAEYAKAKAAAEAAQPPK